MAGRNREINGKARIPFLNEANRSDRDLPGGKGANLYEMTKMGLPVPFWLLLPPVPIESFLRPGIRRRRSIRRINSVLRAGYLLLSSL